MPDIFISEEDMKGEKAGKAKPSGSRVEKVKGSQKKSRRKTPQLARSKRKEYLKPEDVGNIHELPDHSHSPFAAFCYYPDSARFVNEDPEEQIILLLRQHPITNLSWIITSFFMVIAPFVVTAFPLFDRIPFRFVVVATLMWYLITFAFVFEKFLSWFFHVNIITDERIIEVDFTHLLYREITDANIDKIEDVTVEMVGAVRTFFNYGNLEIQTAAEVPRIDFEAVPQPDKVSRILRELRIEEEEEKLEGRVR
jgi:hypothetical protein